MRAWEEHKASADYAGAVTAVRLGGALEESLWALFEAGWRAGRGELALELKRFEVKDGDIVEIKAPEGTPAAEIGRQCQDLVNYFGEIAGKRIVAVAPQLNGFSVEKIPADVLRGLGLRRVNTKAMLAHLQGFFEAAGVSVDEIDATVGGLAAQEAPACDPSESDEAREGGVTIVDVGDPVFPENRVE